MIKFETLLSVNSYELVAVSNGSYQIYNGEICIDSLRGSYTSIKKYFKKVSKKRY